MQPTARLQITFKGFQPYSRRHNLNPFDQLHGVYVLNPDALQFDLSENRLPLVDKLV